MLGLIEKDSQGKITPKRIFGETKVLGVVEAGFPSPAEEELLDTMSLDEYLISNKEATFILQVSGNSMIDAGIMPKDLVLVERTNEAKPGDIVIAEVDGKWTMKYLRQNGDKMYLEAANKKYPPIYPEGRAEDICRGKSGDPEILAMSTPQPLSLHSFPRAIVHIDGDAFFASCEQARNPSL